LSRYNITALVKVAVGLSYPEKPESCLPDGRQGGIMKTYLDKLMENKEFKEKFKKEEIKMINEMSMTKGTIAIDFDGVIHKYSEGWKDGSIYDIPVEGVHNALMGLMKDYWVYIFTTRDVNDVIKWMNTIFWGEGEMGFLAVAMPEGIRFWHGGKGNQIAVSNRKLPAEFYIDDRGIRFSNWEKAIKEIKEIRGW
jgi:hypothetical protein